MKPITYLQIILSVVVLTSEVTAQQRKALPQVSISQTALRSIYSATVGDTFSIYIAYPANYTSSTQLYPTIYLTDANLYFAAVTQLIRNMQIGDEVPQVLIVGIGYKTDSVASRLRSRDFTPTAIPDPFDNHWPTGGAANYLQFINEELKPFIQKNYRVSSEASFAGISYAGLFGLYTLFHEPQTFQNYLIATPSLWYDSLVTFDYEKKFAAYHRNLSAKVFLSVGGLEEKQFADGNMETNVKFLSDRLKKRKYTDLHLKTYVFPNETHFSVPGASFSHGLRYILSKSN
jgi:predicted alpha/beta superfamily hydrolase